MSGLSEEWKVIADRPAMFPHRVRLHVAIERRRPNMVSFCVARPAVFEELIDDQVGVYQDPVMEIPLQAAQAMMDELWKVGLRPAAGAGSAGQLAAVERHLEDMRHLAFGQMQLGVPQAR